MSVPSPDRGVFRWAWHQARQYRSLFWVGACLFSLIVALAVSRVPLPPHPTARENLIATVIAVLAATVMVGVGSYLIALVAAPYQQRNALRESLNRAQGKIGELETAPVTREHGDHLRRIAVRLRDCADSHQPLDYGTDPGQWSRALREHFPELRQTLDTVSEADAAFGVLKERIEKEAIEARMGVPPWTSETFLVRLISTIHTRAVQGILGGPFNFDWHELSPGSGSWYLGEPVYDDFQILDRCDPADVEARKREFEEFFRQMESSPEAVEVRRKLDDGAGAARMAVEQLRIVANTDPITSRCFLCGGASQAG